MDRRGFSVIAGVLVGGLAVAFAGCSWLGEPDRGFMSAVPPVAVTAPAPSYAVESGGRLVVRSGKHESAPAGRDAAVQWLPDGRLLVSAGRPAEFRLVDPTTGRTTARLRSAFGELPSRSVTQVNLLDAPGDGGRLRSYSLDLEPATTTRLPKTDNPDATAYNELGRDYFGATPTIGGVTFVQWHDSSEWYEDGDYGLLRIDTDASSSNTLINERIVGLYLSVDGASLLALQQRNGEPCGGCVVSQDIVEIDPATGKMAADYGTPDGYDRWRVEAMDKVGGRVAVRYSVLDGSGGPRSARLVGTYVHEDGAWSLLPGSDQAVTWWQDGGQVIAKVKESEPLLRDGYELFWTDGTTERPIRGELVAGAVAGRLLPPQD